MTKDRKIPPRRGAGGTPDSAAGASLGRNRRGKPAPQSLVAKTPKKYIGKYKRLSNKDGLFYGSGILPSTDQLVAALFQSLVDREFDKDTAVFLAMSMVQAAYPRYFPDIGKKEVRFLSDLAVAFHSVSSQQSTDTETIEENEQDATQPTMCIPEDGQVRPYPGKRVAGDIHKFLLAAYPYRDGGEPLTLHWLKENDPSGHRALYKHSTPETGPPSDFMASQKASGDEFLNQHNVDLLTVDGTADAFRLYGLLGSRLYPKGK